VCELAMEAQLYLECVRHYPFVLGAQPVRIIDLAAFYAAVANEGARPWPYAVEAIDEDGRAVYRRQPKAPTLVGSADRAAFYQLKSILQGVLARGTARELRHLAPYVAGKTGTTDNENDAWFVGFTNDVTIAVWVGYDNADGRRTLGRGQTGSKVALPIFVPILQAAWTHHAPRRELSPPSPEAQRQLIAIPIDVNTGERANAYDPNAFREQFRLDRWGRFADTQYRLVPQGQAYAYRHVDPWADGEALGGWSRDYYGRPFAQAPLWREAPPSGRGRGLFGQWPWWDDDERAMRRPRRIDPDYPWARRQVY
jgi:penicillin-binding protein 1A